MKPLKSKAQIRKELAEEVENFLGTGGSVQSIPQGVSGNEKNQNLFAQQSAFEPKQSRTPLNEVVKGLEERKKLKKIKVPLRSKRQPRKKMLTDDFGEPLRWVWEE